MQPMRLIATDTAFTENAKNYINEFFFLIFLLLLVIASALSSPFG